MREIPNHQQLDSEPKEHIPEYQINSEEMGFASSNT